MCCLDGGFNGEESAIAEEILRAKDASFQGSTTGAALNKNDNVGYLARSDDHSA